MARQRAIGAAVAILTSAALGAGCTAEAAGGTDSAAVEARRVAVEFFRSQNERRYDDTCRLLSHGFIESHALRDRRTCAAVMRVAFVWNGKIRFRIGKVTSEGGRVAVRAVADGAPGLILLVREAGSLKILSVEGR
jgi:hypothetical protein